MEYQILQDNKMSVLWCKMFRVTVFESKSRDNLKIDDM